MAWLLVGADPLPAVSEGSVIFARVQHITSEDQVIGLNTVGIIRFEESDSEELVQHISRRIIARMNV